MLIKTYNYDIKNKNDNNKNCKKKKNIENFVSNDVSNKQKKSRNYKIHHNSLFSNS